MRLRFIEYIHDDQDLNTGKDIKRLTLYPLNYRPSISLSLIGESLTMIDIRSYPTAIVDNDVTIKSIWCDSHHGPQE